jgi:DNA-binding YbaB/EbfC family protein
MNRDMLRQAQQLQQRMAKIQEELGNESVEGSAGGGVVTVVANGHQVLQSVSIQPDAVDPDDVAMLEDLVMAAVNEALEKARALASQKMNALTGGMKLPGLF